MLINSGEIDVCGHIWHCYGANVHPFTFSRAGDFAMKREYKTANDNKTIHINKR